MVVPFQQPAEQLINVGEVTKRIENGETTYQVGPHEPRGFMVHVGFDWLMFGGLLLLEYVVLFRTPAWGNDRYAAAAMCGPLLLGALAMALHETWWRRVCIKGTERMVLQGSLLIHSGKAFGHGREWRWLARELAAHVEQSRSGGGR
jgi:hypothetical protein